MKKYIENYRHGQKIGFLAVILVFVCVGCGNQIPNLSILEAGEGALESELSNNKLDIIFVIDNSGSMLTKQQQLANSFDSFTDLFINKNFDFNLAIVTTDTRDVSSGGQAGIFQGTPTVLSNSTSNFSSTFKTNVVVGSTGDPNAKAMDAIKLALSDDLTSTSNSGFLREDAHLAIMILSDSDDYDSTTTTSELLEFLEELKPSTEIGSQTKLNYSISSVVVDTSNTENSACAAPFDDGLVFLELSQATDGGIASICESDFSEGLINVSTDIAKAVTAMVLERTPQIGTITVYFDGTVIPESTTNGWSYESSGNKIVFTGDYVPDEGTYIFVNYLPTDIIR